MPLLFEQYQVKVSMANQDSAGTATETPQRMYFLLEDLHFVSMIIVGTFFMACSYQFRIKSIWNENRPHYIMVSKSTVTHRIWMAKKNTDFLHYLKFEFMQLLFFGAYFLMCVFLLCGFSLRAGVVMDEIPVNQRNALISFACVHFLQVVMFQIIVTHGMKGLESEDGTMHNKLIYPMCFLILIGYGCALFFFYLGYDASALTTTISMPKMWVEIESYAVPAFFVYLYLTIRNYNIYADKSKAVKELLAKQTKL